MNEETFARLLQQREEETLDFKQELPGSSDLAMLVSAFYNTRGGTIIIGVDDQRRPVGVDRPQSVEAGIVNIIRDRLDLDVLPTIKIVAYQGREFVVVTCPRGTRRPYFVRGEVRPYIRVGSTNRQATAEEIRRLYLEGGEVRYETLPKTGAALSDLSSNLIGRYTRRREALTDMPLLLSHEELLRNLGCAVEADGKLVPTHAGVLLFAEEPQRWLPQSEVTCVRFKGTDVITYLDRQDLRGPLPEMVLEAERFVYRNTRTGHRVVGFEGIDYPEYPREAVREALVNAVIHRDYSLLGQGIRVFVFDDRIEVHSPGTLLPEITLEEIRQLKSRSVLRNRTIVEVFRDLGGFIEKLGTGIRRMTAAMEQHGLPRPQFEELSGEFVVTLIGPGEKFMQEAPPAWMQGLNERQIKAMEHVARRGRVTNKEYRELFAVSDTTALNDLTDLVTRGLLVTIGSRRGRFYKLAENAK
jgi:ATP-dependent DNA helicase RecG